MAREIRRSGYLPDYYVEHNTTGRALLVIEKITFKYPYNKVGGLTATFDRIRVRDVQTGEESLVNGIDLGRKLTAMEVIAWTAR